MCRKIIDDFFKLWQNILHDILFKNVCKRKVDAMLYIHYCQKCERVHMLNGHNKNCIKCETPLAELPISFLQYTSYNSDERVAFLMRLKTEGKI